MAGSARSRVPQENTLAYVQWTHYGIGMGYLHIPNLYKEQAILLFRECYALEKIHGTSAHIQCSKSMGLTFSSGGAQHSQFIKLFDQEALHLAIKDMGHESIVIYGEAYGGKQQKQGWRYGPDLKFVAFDVCIDDMWLAVPIAHKFCAGLGIDFVHYDRISTDLASIDAARDAPSTQGIRNGMGEHRREGVVLRPLIELRTNNGERVISKHKREEERETAQVRVVDDPAKLKILEDAQAIAIEWVTETRLDHVLDKLPANLGMDNVRTVLDAMVEDVLREGAGELTATKEARKAISAATVHLFKNRLDAKMRTGA